MPIDPAAVLDQAEQDLYDNASVRALATDAQSHLGQLQQAGRAAWHTRMTAYERSLGHPEAGLLRRGLARWLATDRSFDTAHMAAIDRRIIESAHRRADVVIGGHTHLPKFRIGDPTYINTGTWMRVLKLTDSPGSTATQPSRLSSPWSVVRTRSRIWILGLGTAFWHRRRRLPLRGRPAPFRS